jgi:hypothetical protein
MKKRSCERRRILYPASAPSRAVIAATSPSTRRLFSRAVWPETSVTAERGTHPRLQHEPAVRERRDAVQRVATALRRQAQLHDDMTVALAIERRLVQKTFG